MDCKADPSAEYLGRPPTRRGSFLLDAIFVPFRAYLHKIKKVSNPSCVYCGATNDHAEHTFFQCDRWAAPRLTLGTEVRQLIPENFIRGNDGD